jgi:hypothetical protein
LDHLLLGRISESSESAQLALHKPESEHEEETNSEAGHKFTAMVRERVFGEENPLHLYLLSKVYPSCRVYLKLNRWDASFLVKNRFPIEYIFRDRA